MREGRPDRDPRGRGPIDPDGSRRIGGRVTFQPHHHDVDGDVDCEGDDDAGQRKNDPSTTTIRSSNQNVTIFTTVLLISFFHFCYFFFCFTLNVPGYTS